MYIIIVGCGRVGSELARLLAEARHNVVVIDKAANAFQRLGTDFNGVTIAGNGFDVDLLKEAGIEHTDAFCTVTDNDNANIMSGQVAKKIFHIPKVITRINDTQYKHIYKELGIDIVNSTTLLASMIRNKITESRSSSFILEGNDLDMIEIEAGDMVAGKKVEEINLPGELLITAIIRKQKQKALLR
jgi:trk system potassium uptake protein TrkA